MKFRTGRVKIGTAPSFARGAATGIFRNTAGCGRNPHSMRALVTGGAGFIGSNLAAQLVRDGHDVVVLDNFQSGHRQNLESLPSVRLVEGDVREASCVGRAINGAQVVFHLAASVGNKRSIDQPVDDAEINVIGTLRVLEAARVNAVSRVVLSSSAGIFGELKTLPIREDHPVDPDSPYGCTKLCAEKLALAYAKLYGLGVVSLRYFNVYGPHQRYDAYGNAIPIFAFQLLRGQPLTIFGDGEQTRDFVNVQDVVHANIRAAASDVTGAFNIGSATAVTINALIALLAEVSGLEPETRFGPPRAGDVRHSLADISAARRAFGYSPSVPLAVGLRTYMDWAQEETRRS
jgi:UDP-glucose 4-epimerase